MKTSLCINCYIHLSFLFLEIYSQKIYNCHSRGEVNSANSTSHREISRYNPIPCSSLTTTKILKSQ